MKKNYLTIYYLLIDNSMKLFTAILILMLIFFSPSILSAQGKTIEIKIIDKQYQPPAMTPKIPQEFKDKGARFVVRVGDNIKICNGDKLFAKPTSLSKENKFQGIEGAGGLPPGSCITIEAQNPGNQPISFWLHDDIHGSARIFMVVLPANWPEEGEENTPQLSMACKLQGTWAFECCDKRYKGKMTITQKDNKITGYFGETSNGSVGDIDGQVTGNSVKFTRKWGGSKQEYTLTLSGDCKTLTGSFNGDRDMTVGTEVTATKQ